MFLRRRIDYTTTSFVTPLFLLISVAPIAPDARGPESQDRARTVQFRAGTAVAEPRVPPITLSVTPKLGVEPAAVRVRVRIDPHDDNRFCDLVIEGAQYRRASRIPLEGSHAAITHEFTYEQIPGGPYTVSAQLQRTSGVQHASDSLCVSSRFGASECSRLESK